MKVTEVKVRPYHSNDEQQVIELWHQCNLVVPWNDPKRDIELKLKFQPHMFLVGAKDDLIVASIMVGYEGHRGWINYLAVLPNYQRQGIGWLMMNAAEAELKKLGCPKVNLQVRSSNKSVIAFYEKIGFTDSNVISMGKCL
ncbi:MAG: GNAT family acetyltransferase [Nostoc sp. ZfuVER08]|uniref:GNAT family acetyltransferase n=1 Tax=Nostoc punctiforme FACHB-252 TaxID=1357509 RepID=A0ABR8H830_NOSPU|nr:GNAT family acetyltransferase [Nostoc punctiforme]MBD2612000.1 GNAT family acetyltransferase [Nostoc punctiforme FACHB-252]MBL1202209.1 GNAT family acetyltransferase [Nostoc sp. GBBB01]MDZ8010560.1 GNAT family acetyltransferase [Nostoc sp. ZfuVER08]